MPPSASGVWQSLMNVIIFYNLMFLFAVGHLGETVFLNNINNIRKGWCHSVPMLNQHAKDHGLPPQDLKKLRFYVNQVQHCQDSEPMCPFTPLSLGGEINLVVFSCPTLEAWDLLGANHLELQTCHLLPKASDCAFSWLRLSSWPTIWTSVDYTDKTAAPWVLEEDHHGSPIICPFFG